MSILEVFRNSIFSPDPSFSDYGSGFAFNKVYLRRDFGRYTEKWKYIRINNDIIKHINIT